MMSEPHRFKHCSVLREGNYVVTVLPVPKMYNEAQGMVVCWGRKTIFDNSIAD